MIEASRVLCRLFLGNLHSEQRGGRDLIIGERQAHPFENLKLETAS